MRLPYEHNVASVINAVHERGREFVHGADKCWKEHQDAPPFYRNNLACLIKSPVFLH